MDLVCRYSPEEYPHYENYDAIEVGQTQDIPFDYDGIMGVPITFLDKYNPEQFEIIGSNSSTDLCKELGVKPLGEDWIRGYRAAGGTGHNTANMVRIVYNDSKTGKALTMTPFNPDAADMKKMAADWEYLVKNVKSKQDLVDIHSNVNTCC